jgi:hypothetical protein
MLFLALAHLAVLSSIQQAAPGAPQAPGGVPRAEGGSAAGAQSVPEFEVVPLQNAVAGEVANSLRNLVPGGTRFMPDARTNSLLLMSSGENLAGIKALIAELDRPVTAAKPAAEHVEKVSHEDDLFAPVSRDLVIELGDGGVPPNLLTIARQYERLTGQIFLVGQEVEAMLANTPSGLGTGVNVPAGEAQAFLEHLFAFNSFYLVPLRGSSPRLIEVFSLKVQDRNRIQQRLCHVAPDEAESFSARHPAVPIVTVYTMKNTDVRQLCNSMRTMLPDADLSFMLPAGATNSMVIGGLSSAVVQQLSVLRIVEQCSPYEQPAAPAAQPGPK